MVQTNQKLLRTLDCSKEPMLVVDIQDPAWPIMVANSAWTSVLGVPWACV